MTQSNFRSLDDNDLDLVCGGGAIHIALDTDPNSKVVSSRPTDTGSLGDIALNPDPDGPQSSLG